MGPERLQGVVQSPDFVIYCEHEAGAIVVRRSGALAAENEEASSVAAVILHAGLEDIELIFFGGERAGDSSGRFAFAGQLSGSSG